MSNKDESIVYPEIVSASRRDGTGERWTVRGGLAERGDAWTNFDQRIISVPLVDDEIAEVVRIHELVHAKVSPNNSEAISAFLESEGIAPEIMKSVEEIRVNALVKFAGYNTDLLVDGSEKPAGQRLARAGNANSRNSAIIGGSALIGTKAFRQFVSGVRSVDKALADKLRAMEKEVLKNLRYHGEFGIERDSTIDFRGSDGNIYSLPTGFTEFNKDVSQIISQYLEPLSPKNEKDGRGSSGIPIDTGVSGFATLNVHPGLRLTKKVSGKLSQKHRPSTTGKRFAYPSRLLTDPERRVFQSKVRSNGGIVLIDLSGSMSITVSEIQSIVDTAPGSLVVGYSHQRMSPHRPNFWVLADRGLAVSTLNGVDSGHGNCVDGPALEWVISQRRKNEPIIWVCDGAITNRDDQAYFDGAKACAKIVVKHDVIMVENVPQALVALKNPKNVKRKTGRSLARFLPVRYGGIL